MHLFKVCTWLLCLLPHSDHDYNYFYHLPRTINSKLVLLSGIFDISNTSDRPNLVHHGCCVGGWNWPATVRDNMDCNSMARVYTLTNSLISYVTEEVHWQWRRRRIFHCTFGAIHGIQQHLWVIFYYYQSVRWISYRGLWRVCTCEYAALITIITRATERLSGNLIVIAGGI